MACPSEWGASWGWGGWLVLLGVWGAGGHGASPPPPTSASPCSGLLPNAVVPPSADHLYAQWRQPEEPGPEKENEQPTPPPGECPNAWVWGRGLRGWSRGRWEPRVLASS